MKYAKVPPRISCVVVLVMLSSGERNGHLATRREWRDEQSRKHAVTTDRERRSRRVAYATTCGHRCHRHVAPAD